MNTVKNSIKLDRYFESCNTLDDLSDKVFIPTKTEDLNLSVFNIITGINESKILKKHVSFQCKCRFDARKWNSGQWWNDDKCRCECKKHHTCEKSYVWNPATCDCENEKYFASIMDDSAILCDEGIDADVDHKAELQDKINLNEKKQPVKSNIFMF